ncbi:hypothetical protein B0H19DRAFT_1160949 [Mycena capillaripes]|nr:hypothetical protein B0H19DRAFT_1160949 [Mycena capillaripes]
MVPLGEQGLGESNCSSISVSGGPGSRSTSMSISSLGPSSMPSPSSLSAFSFFLSPSPTPFPPSALSPSSLSAFSFFHSPSPTPFPPSVPPHRPCRHSRSSSPHRRRPPHRPCRQPRSSSPLSMPSPLSASCGSSAPRIYLIRCSLGLELRSPFRLPNAILPCLTGPVALGVSVPGCLCRLAIGIKYHGNPGLFDGPPRVARRLLRVVEPLHQDRLLEVGRADLLNVAEQSHCVVQLLRLIVELLRLQRLLVELLRLQRILLELLPCSASSGSRKASLVSLWPSFANSAAVGTPHIPFPLLLLLLLLRLLLLLGRLYQKYNRCGRRPVAKKPKLIRNTELSGASAVGTQRAQTMGKEDKMMY